MRQGTEMCKDICAVLQERYTPTSFIDMKPSFYGPHFGSVLYRISFCPMFASNSKTESLDLYCIECQYCSVSRVELESSYAKNLGKLATKLSKATSSGLGYAFGYSYF